MRIKKVNEKKLEKVEIPSRLRKFFGWVSEALALKEECTQIPSDDLIQDDYTYGGLIHEGGKEYSFTYFPTEGNKNIWEFQLSAEQIGQIAEGKLTTLDLWACTQEDCQSKFQNSSDTCFYHDYYDDDEEEKPIDIAKLIQDHGKN